MSLKGRPADRTIPNTRRLVIQRAPKLEPIGLHIQARIILIPQQHQILSHGGQFPVEEVLGGLEFALVEVALVPRVEHHALAPVTWVGLGLGLGLGMALGLGLG